MQQPGNGPSIRDIAQIAGVSTATVSRVLNHKGGYSAETEQRVLAVLEANGYIGNMAAKTLREAKSKTIGLILPNIDNPFYSCLAYHIESMLYEKGYSLLICNSAERLDKEVAYFRTLIGKHVDGVLCASPLAGFPENFPLHTLPVVCIDRIPGEERAIPCVVNDDYAAGKCATEHLIRKGCRKILLVTFHVQGQTAGWNQRARGYLDALEENHIPADRNYILERPGREAPSQEFEILVRSFLREGRFPLDGVVGTSEAAAIGALFALKDRGLRVPQDVKLVTFDNTLQSVLTQPGLTSIDRKPQLLAQRAVELLLEMIAGNPPQRRIHTVPFELVARDSSL